MTMIAQIVKRDLSRNKMITIVLMVFILLSSLLVSSGAGLIVKLVHTMEYFLDKSSVPHVVQMHAGEIDPIEIDRWSAHQHFVRKHQTVEMINVDGTAVYIGNVGEAETNSVMDISFVTQNDSFDFLLDSEHQVIHISRGNIGVPIYYKQRHDLQIGDKVTVSTGIYEQEFTISHFVHDALMNPAIIHSKRFLVHEDDFVQMKNSRGEVEYLLEFQLHDPSQLEEFHRAYQTSGLPNQGPVIDVQTLKVLNALTDGLIAATMILVSMLLIIIAIFCVRLTLLATMEEDYREIGVMIAIGMSHRFIKAIYLSKYIVITAIASVAGVVLSFFLQPIFSHNLMLYMGTAPKSMLERFVPILVASMVGAIILFFCLIVLRRFKHISAIQALRGSSGGEFATGRQVLSLHKRKYVPLHVFLGIQELASRPQMYGILSIVFVFCVFMILVPINFNSTIQSPNFVSYMGIGQSDIRIDLQRTDDIVERFQRVIDTIANDEDVEKFAASVTRQYKVADSDGIWKMMGVETGDLSTFPLNYLEGRAPEHDDEIALSYLNGEDLGVGVGDRLRMITDQGEQVIVVSGIYQDITHGGRTAKAIWSVNHEDVLWYVISLNVKPHVQIDDKVREYTALFQSAKVTHLKSYLAETLGDTIKQVRLLAIFAVIIAICLAILITALFVKMLIAKDASQIEIMKSLGFSLRHIQVQYVTRVLFVLCLAVFVGTILANTVGQSLVSVIWSFMGAAQINFSIDPIRAYLLCPLLFAASVALATLFSTTSIKQMNIADMNAE